VHLCSHVQRRGYVISVFLLHETGENNYTVSSEVSMKASRTVLFALLFISAAFSLSAQKQPDWGIVFTGPEDGIGSVHPESVEKIDFPATVKAPSAGASVAGEGSCLWLVADFSAETWNTDGDLVVDFDEVSGPVEFYLNGKRLGRYGVVGPDYFMQSGIHVNFSVSSDLLEPGSNIFALKIYSDSDQFRIQRPVISRYTEVINGISRLSFLNGGIFMAFSVMVLFIGLYYLSLYLFNRRVVINLLFSLANLFLGVYFAQMGLPYRILPSLGFLLIAKYSLFLYFTFLTLFFISFFNVFNRKWVKTFVSAIAVIMAVNYIFHRSSYAVIMNAFDTALLPGGAELLLMLAIAGYSMLKKNTDAVPVFIGVLVGLGSAVYDFYYALSGTEPDFWLQGFGILVFNVCMFEMLSIRAIRAEKQLKASAAQISENSRVMEQFIGKIETISLSVADMSSNLDNEIEASAGSVEELVNGTGIISASAGEQLQNVKETGQSLEALLASSEQINQELNRQQTDVKETSHLITEMLDNISNITEKLKKTSDFTEELGQLTARGEHAVTKSADTVSAIHEDSKNIYQILSSITDISEQTNLLAMNAAIEAAHAGKAGAGFAVVAGEIRSLAVNTAGRTRETVEQIDNIVSSIKEAYESNLEVKDLLLHIGANTKTAVEQVKSVYLAIEEQRTAGRAVLATIESLNKASEGIKVETGKQQLKSHDMELKQNNLRIISDRVYQSVGKMSEANAKIISALEKVRRISAGTNAEAVRLKEMLADSGRNP